MEEKSCSCCKIDEDEGEEGEFLGWPFKEGLARGIFTFAKVIVSLGLVLCAEYIPNIPVSWFYFMVYFGYALISYDVIVTAIYSIIHKEFFNETILMLLGTGGALYIKAFPEAIFVLSFYQIGEFFEDLASDKAKDSVEKLINDMPLYAHFVNENDQIIEKQPEDLKINDIIKILPGEKIPVDGIVIKGSSELDTSSLTGESIPLRVEENNQVISGSINMDGVLFIRVNKEFKDSTLSKILDLINSEEKGKSKSEKFITKFSRYYTPIVILLAILGFVILFGLSGWNVNEGLNKAIYQACNMLIISCPCALVISIPLSFFISIGRSSKDGILVKGGQSLENLYRAKTFVFDKTGTLTQGKFEVKEYSSKEALKLIASIENNSTHPIAKSILDKYGKNEFVNFDSIENIPGKGIKATKDKKDYYLGDYSYAVKYNPSIEKKDTPYKVIYLVSENENYGYVIISDIIKKEAKESLFRLKQEGVEKLVMLSGDNSSIVEEIKSELNLDYAKGELLPEGKLDELNIIKSESKKKVAYVGDGINDAPCLLASDVGISMGQVGSDAANESSDVVIVNDDLKSLVKAKKIASKTMLIVFENIAFILLVKLIILILSFCGISNMYLAAGADTGTLLLSILNSMRLWLPCKK